MDRLNSKNNPTDNLLNKPTADYEKAEMDLLKESLNRSYTERFLFATRLYKIQQTLKRAKITHQPFPTDK